VEKDHKKMNRKDIVPFVKEEISQKMILVPMPKVVGGKQSKNKAKKGKPFLVFWG
jgi:hypothetical protein